MGLVKPGRRLAPPSGGGNVANVGVLPVPMLPISNWGLKLAHVGSQNEVPQEAGDLV